MASGQMGAATGPTATLEGVEGPRSAPSGLRLLAARYELHERIGGGGMGAVYLGRDRKLERPVAVKILPPGLAGDSAAVARFAREARSAAALTHPNIVAVFDAGVDRDTSFIVMEHVDGESLAALVRREGRLPAARAATIAAQLARALAAAHRHGIVHRDVKPGNVVLAPFGQVKLLDFGIARALSAASLTEAGWVLGSSGYLAPEVARGAPAEAASDVYALGCLLYELLTARAPFRGDDPAAVLRQHVSSAPPPPSALAPDIPAGLEALVMRTLAKQAADRPEASELAAALERLAGSPWPARAGSRRARPVAQPAGRRRRQPAVTALLAAAAVAVVVALMVSGGLSPGRGVTRAQAAHTASADGGAWLLPVDPGAISRSMSGLVAAALVQLQPPVPAQPTPASPPARSHHAPRPGHGPRGRGHHGHQGRFQRDAAGPEAGEPQQAPSPGGTEAPAGPEPD